MVRLTLEQRIEAVIKKEQGYSYTDIAQQLGVSRLSIIRLVKKQRMTGSVKDVAGRGRKRATTSRQDRQLVRACLSNRRLTSGQLRQQMAATGVHVSSRTVRNRLKEACLVGRVAAKKPLLSQRNQKDRLDFARRHRHWTTEDWGRVLWSDETSVELFDTRRRVYVRRRQGERYNQECLVPTVKFGGGKLMVWGCFSRAGVGELRRVDGTINQHSYKAMMAEAMMPSGERLFGGEEYIFQQDNAPCHKAKSVMDFFRQKKINVMDWPPQSPDFNPIENLWGILKRKVGLSKPSNLDELWNRLQELWLDIGQEEIRRLIESMPNRMRLAIKAKGKSTRY